MVRKMAKEMMEAMVKIISRKKRKKKIMIVSMVALIMVIYNAHLVRIMLRPKRKQNNKDRIPGARRGNLEKQLTLIP